MSNAADVAASRPPTTRAIRLAARPVGSFRRVETVVDGLDQAPRALIDLLRGAAVGKMIVRLG